MQRAFLLSTVSVAWAGDKLQCGGFDGGCIMRLTRTAWIITILNLIALGLYISVAIFG